MKAFLCAGILLLFVENVFAQDNIIDLLKVHQFDLSGDGKYFLLKESQEASFMLLGELHGENEIPQLLYFLWPEMNKFGYHHIAAEVSPWAAHKLEFGKHMDTLQVEGLWTNKEARFVHAINGKYKWPTIWGCDMEEISLGQMIGDLRTENRQDSVLTILLSQIKDGYNRKMSPDLLLLLRNYKPVNNIPLYESIIGSLKIDSARAYSDSRFKAQLLREELMKKYFMMEYRNLPKEDSKKILFRFGRNHLHRGFDARGISTLGNFVSEFAVAKGVKSFNVAVFAAGGQCALLGDTFDADERKDDPAFQFLSEQARFDATIFDLRPVRYALHRLRPDERTNSQNRLLYWADSYDAIICYKSVTPRSG